MNSFIETPRESIIERQVDFYVDNEHLVSAKELAQLFACNTLLEDENHFIPYFIDFHYLLNENAMLNAPQWKLAEMALSEARKSPNLVMDLITIASFMNTVNQQVQLPRLNNREESIYATKALTTFIDKVFFKGDEREQLLSQNQNAKSRYYYLLLFKEAIIDARISEDQWQCLELDLAGAIESPNMVMYLLHSAIAINTAHTAY